MIICESKRSAVAFKRAGDFKLASKVAIGIATLVIVQQCLYAGGLEAGERGDRVTGGGSHIPHVRLVLKTDGVAHLHSADLVAQDGEQVNHGDTAQDLMLAPDPDQEGNQTDNRSGGDTNDNLLCNVGYVERHLNSSYFWFGIPIGLMCGVIAGFMLLNKFAGRAS